MTLLFLLFIGNASAANFYTQISMGPTHVYALTAEAKALCWGSDSQGQLGNGDMLVDQVDSPGEVVTPLDFGDDKWVSIQAGTSYSCGLTAHGKIYCWGDDSYGELGNGRRRFNKESPDPVDMSGELVGRFWLALKVGGNGTCALADNGQSYCWGYDPYHPVDRPTRVDTQGLQWREQRIPHFSDYCGTTEFGVAYCVEYDENDVPKLLQQRFPGNGATWLSYGAAPPISSDTNHFADLRVTASAIAGETMRPGSWATELRKSVRSQQRLICPAN